MSWAGLATSPAPSPSCPNRATHRSTVTLQQRITTPFNFESTAAAVIAGVDLIGKRAIVTGEAWGIGAEPARALPAVGAEVTLALRNMQAGERAAAEMRSSTGN